MKKFMTMFVAVAAASCGSDGLGGGDDTLPKRGEFATDPTIVSALGSCRPADGYNPEYLIVSLRASDPAGQDNLGSCAVVFDGMTDQDGFGGSSECDVAFSDYPCADLTSLVIDLTVSNNTAGVTTASVEISVSR